MLPKADACIFCGGLPLRPEHVFSRGWLSKLWKVRKGEQLAHRRVREEEGDEFDVWWSHAKADLEVWCVCEGCNSGWMNTLDRRAQRIIDPLTRGDASAIKTLWQISLVGEWAMKLAFMFDWQQGEAVLPPELAREFRDRRTPPRTACIWFARHIPVAGIDGHASAATRSVRVGDRTDLYLCTFRVDQLVAQILVTPPKKVSPVRTRHGGAVRKIWPLTYETFIWPPARTLDDFEYIAFCEAFLRDYERSGI